MHFLAESWDVWLFSLVNQEWRTPLLDWLMPLVSVSALLWVLSVGLLAWAARVYGRGRAVGVALMLISALAATDASSHALKDMVGRVRPLNVFAQSHYREDGEWRQRPADFVQTKPAGSSYPSAHASNSMAAALILALGVPLLRPWIFAMPLVVGYSRLYLGKHYPSDVLQGWALGLVVAGLLWLLWDVCAPRHLRFRRGAAVKRQPT